LYKVSRPQRETVCEMLSEFSRPVLPLLCNSTSLSVMSSWWHRLLKWFTDDDKAVIKIKFLWVNKHYGDKRLWKESVTKNWSLRGLNKLLKKLNETSNDRKVPVGHCQCVAMTALNSLSSLTLSQKEKPIIAQPNIEPTFLYKFHQFFYIYSKVILRQ